jgi:hypothetical protein
MRFVQHHIFLVIVIVIVVVVGHCDCYEETDMDILSPHRSVVCAPDKDIIECGDSCQTHDGKADLLLASLGKDPDSNNVFVYVVSESFIKQKGLSDLLPSTKQEKNQCYCSCQNTPLSTQPQSHPLEESPQPIIEPHQQSPPISTPSPGISSVLLSIIWRTIVVLVSYMWKIIPTRAVGVMVLWIWSMGSTTILWIIAGVPIVIWWITDAVIAFIVWATGRDPRSLLFISALLCLFSLVLGAILLLLLMKNRHCCSDSECGGREEKSGMVMVEQQKNKMVVGTISTMEHW